MTDEEKKAVEAENKDLKALSEEEIEGVAGGRKPSVCPRGGAIYNATGQPAAECVRQA